MALELRVDLRQVREEAGFERRFLCLIGDALAGSRCRAYQRMRLREATTTHAYVLDVRVNHELVLDHRRRDIFSLAGLEQLLLTAGDPKATLLVDLAEIASFEEAILGERLLRELGGPIVAHHVPRRLDQDLTAAADLGLHSLLGVTDVAEAGLPGPGQV